MSDKVAFYKIVPTILLKE